MTFSDYFINLILSAVLIIGAYQFYFFTQRHPLRKPIVWDSVVDEEIPFRPRWSWVYSFLYYPAILYLNLIATDHRHFIMMAFSFLVLLFMQMLFFGCSPSPRRRTGVTSIRVRPHRNGFLQFVQKFDQSSNCFPSMHVSVAMLTALHAMPVMGGWAFLFPVLIAISCIFTKQHYLIDLPAGAALGAFAYWLYLPAA